MSILEPNIFSVLTGDAAVSALVGTRVYPIKLPHEPTYPAITYSRVASEKVNAFDGYKGLEDARIQVDCWASTYAQAKDLAEKVISAMINATPFKARVASDTDLYDDDTGTYRVSVDFYIWYQTT